MVAGVELPINRFASAQQMAELIFGDGVTVQSASFTGDQDSSGIFTNGDAISPGVTPADTGVLFSTGDLRGFTNNNAAQSNLSTSTTTASSGPNNNPDFNAAAGGPTFDASFLDVDFIPTGDTLTAQFVFASEEFPEFANGAFQDFVGVWINGTQVELGIGDGDIDPNNLNAGSAQNLFIDNTADQFNTELDGFTVTLSLNIPVNSGVVNSLRLGIADVADNNFDSTLLVAADSLQTTVIANDDISDLPEDGSRTLDLLANDTNQTSGTLSISQINGQDVSVGSIVTLNTGQTVQLNGDGTVTIFGDGDTEIVDFTYQIESNSGGTDTGFVTLNSIPCFVKGTHVLCECGEVAVEDLEVGDLVLTKDEGLMPVRWIGSRSVEGTGRFAPIHINANTFGSHKDIWISPLHRILIRDSLAELLFGEAEVLVAAKDLINDHSVRQEKRADVTYFHLLFDRHQVIYSEGLETESFLPGPQMKHSFEQEILNELCGLLPEIASHRARGCNVAARHMLNRFEVQLLSKRWAA